MNRLISVTLANINNSKTKISYKYFLIIYYKIKGNFN